MQAELYWADTYLTQGQVEFKVVSVGGRQAQVFEQGSICAGIADLRHKRILLLQERAVCCVKVSGDSLTSNGQRRARHPVD